MKKKNKNQLPQMFWGGKLAPQLFDLAANTLINGTTYAVTDMIKAIREPEQEMRPTKMNTGFTMENGGTVGGKPKYVKVNGKRMKIDSPEYREYYQQVMNDREQGIFYNSPVDEVTVIGKKMTKAEKKKAQEERDLIQTLFEQYEEKEKLNDPYNPNSKSIITEPKSKKPFNHTLGYNILEGVDPTGITSYPDVYEAWTDGELNWSDVIEPLGALPVLGKLGKVTKVFKGATPKTIYDNIYGGLDLLGNAIDTSSDIYQDNVVNKANGGMIKRADGSYSKRGLWDNIRANKGSGKKPTKQMLEQERKIKAQMDNGGIVNPTLPFQQRLNQYLKQPGFNPNIMGMSTGRNNVGLGLRGGPLRQMTSLTNDRRLAPFDNFTFNNNYTDPKFNLNTKLGYQDRFGFKGGVDYTSAIGENNPDTKFNVGFDKYGITGDYNYNLNKENPNFNYGVGYKGFGFDTDFRATKEKDKLYNYDAKLGYDRGNTSGNFEFTGNRDDYNLGADFRINGIGANFKYANKKNDFKSNAPGLKNFKADAPDNNSNFNVGLLDYDKDGITAKYAISKDNQNPLVHNAKVGYNRKGLDANLSFMGNKLDPNYNFNLNFVPEKGGFTTNANLDFKNNNIDATTGLGYKGKKFNAGVNYKSRINTEEETARQSVNARAGYKGKNFNAGIDYDRQFATDENPAVNRAGLNLGYNKNGFNVNTGVKYKTLSEADKEKEKASPFEVTAGVTYNPNYKKPKQKTTPWKLPKELMKKNEVIRMIDENQLTPQQRMLNEFKSQFTPINLGKRAFGGMITPDMYMQQLMYGSYANGGEIPQNIPVEVEGGEAYELPNGQMGEFEGPSHDNGGIPVALPEQTKVYSKQLKVNGKTMADRKTKREANVAKLEKILSKNPSDKFVREALKRQQETAALEEQQDMAMQEQANQQQQMQEQAQQGMMQEQAMAGLMQDPAMMQQMGMMMYGGTLNKLANGGEPEPIKPLPMKQIYDLRYPNKTIDVPYNEKFTGVHDNKPVTQEMFPLNNDMPNPFPMYNPFTPEEWKIMTNTKFRDDEDYPLAGYGIESSFTNSDELNKFYDAKLKDVNTLSRKSSLVPTVKNNYLEEMADLAQRASGGRGTSFTYYPNDYDGRDKQWPYVTTFGGKSMESNTNKYTPSVVKDNNPEPNAPKTEPKVVTSVVNQNLNKFPSDVESDVESASNALKINKAFRKGGSGKIDPPGVNPYDVMSNILGQTFGNIAISKDPYINTKGGMIPNPLYNEVIGNKMLKEEEPKKPNKFMNWLNKAADETGDFFVDLFTKDKNKPKKEKAKKEETKSANELPFTPGDYMGMAGTLFGGLAPMTTTMLNRMMTPKNQNFFREYGAEGLRAMQEAQALSAINRDKQLADIKLGEEASRQRGRNSARGVNTLRAMDISSDIAANQAQNQAYNAYAQQMMQMLGQKAQMENQQDQMVMQGEYQRDLADRQDVDQFYTNLAQNFASQSELMQKQGRDMNQAQYNKMILEMSPMFSKYGIGVKMKDGKVVFTKDGETIDETTVRLKIQEELKKEAEQKKVSTTTETVIPVNSNVLPAINPLGLGHTPYFNPIFTDINIPTITDKSLTKAATKRRK